MRQRTMAHAGQQPHARGGACLVGLESELGWGLGFEFGFGLGLGSGVGPGFEGCGLVPSRSPTLKQPTRTSGYQPLAPMWSRSGWSTGLGQGWGSGLGFGFGLGLGLGGQAGRQAMEAGEPINPNSNPYPYPSP